MSSHRHSIEGWIPLYCLHFKELLMQLILPQLQHLPKPLLCQTNRSSIERCLEEDGFSTQLAYKAHFEADYNHKCFQIYITINSFILFELLVK